LFALLLQQDGGAAGGIFANMLGIQAAPATPATGATGLDVSALMTGLQGLPTALPGAPAAPATDAVAMPVAATNTQATPTPVALEVLLTSAGLQVKVMPLGQDGATDSDPASLAGLADGTEQVQEVLSQAGISVGDLSDPATLRQGLAALGVTGQKGEDLAQQIGAALKQMKKKLGLDDSQTGVMALVMVAAALLNGAATPGTATTPAPAQSTPLTLQVMRADARGRAAAGRTFEAPVTGRDWAREIAGLTPAADKPAGATDGTKAAEAKAPAEATAVAVPTVAVTVAAGAVTVQAAPAKSLKSNDKDAPAVRGVGAASVVAPAAGEVHYLWHGGDKAEAVGAAAATPAAGHTQSSKDAASAVRDAAATAGRTEARAELLAAHGGGAGPAAASPDDGKFADMVKQYQQRLDLAQRFDVAGQTVVQMRHLIAQSGGDGGGEVRVRLNPPELGEIHVDLVVRNGEVSGRISASDPAVVTALARDVHHFGQGLRDAGLKLGQQGLSFMLSQQQHQNPQQQNRQAPPAPVLAGAGERFDGDVVTLEGAAPATNWVAADKLLDVRI
jgi:flagellar hook-length control protein FliK